ncbi:MAG: hypothetical protein II921_09730 [Treponema sp.]|nr:hypothetical protein [Treponema sp.]
MKKFMKGLLALAGALSFLAVGCSGGTTYVGTSSSASGDKSTTVTASKLGFSALTAESADTNVATAEVVSGDVKITGVKAGETTVTVTGTKTSADIAGVSLDTTTVTKKIKVVVASTLAVTATPEDDTSDNGGSDDSKKEKETATTKATAKTYNFVGLSFSDFPEGSLTKKTDGSTVLTELGTETQPYLAKNTDGVTVAGATIVTGSSKRISARFSDSKTTAINIGNSNMSSATSVAADNYIKITAPAAGTVTVTYKITASTASDKIGAADATVALTSADSVLESKKYDTTYATYSALDDDGKKATYSDQTITATLSAAGDVYVGYFRGTGAGTGNIDVYKIEYTPAE